MRKLLCCFLMVLLIASCTPQQTVSVAVSAPAAWPTTGWQTASPESQGMDSALLADMLDQIDDSHANLYSLLVVRNGVLVTEYYAHPYTAETATHIQSITKSVIGMLVGRAVQTGAIMSADETLVSFFPGRVNANNSREKESITLRHLLSMSSGLDCREFSADDPKMEQSNAWVQFMLDLPVVSTPGKKFNYCNGSAHLLSAIIEKSTGMSAREFANAEMFAPLGIPEVSAEDWGADPKGYSIGGYGLHLRPVDLAKLGLFSLQDGVWDGERLLPEGWVAESTTQHVKKDDGAGYGYMWTVYPKQGRYSALGLGGQQIHVYPTKNLIVVVTAGLPAYTEAPEVEKMLSDFILPAVKSDSALPENPDTLARLNATVAWAASPATTPAPLPEIALAVSGSTYTFAENPFAWQTMTFTFTPGADTTSLLFNGVPLEIGMDNIYRQNQNDLLGAVLLRGAWVDGKTFVVHYPYAITGPNRLGALGETELRFTFADNQMELTATPLIFGGEPVTMRATR